MLEELEVKEGEMKLEVLTNDRKSHKPKRFIVLPKEKAERLLSKKRPVFAQVVDQSEEGKKQSRRKQNGTPVLDKSKPSGKAEGDVDTTEKD